MLALFGWDVLFDPGVDHSLAGRLFGAGVLVTFTWFIWRVGGYPRIEVTPTHLVVRNPILTHEIPWRAIDAIETFHGLTLALWDRREIRVLALSGSMLADLFGDRTLHRAEGLIAVGRRNAPAGPGALMELPRRRIQLRWLLLPLVLVVVTIVVWAAWQADPLGGAPT
nr:PH domain-containing protein [Actinopolymorpha rutila]